ncbi:MAG: nuclear transport factor 2 family protein [Bacteroidia bacterium]|nr:nuclear transport factor 2 family protein [Bacteroidia bacterium]
MGNKLDNATRLYLEGIRDGNPKEAIEKYTGQRYRQHSTGVKDGKEGFLEFFEDFIKRNPKREIDIIRGWEDGRYVFVQAYQSLNDGKSRWITTDFFDTDDEDRMIEHWDVISAYSDKLSPSGRTSIDGETTITDLDKTEENKAIVRAVLEGSLMRGGDLSVIDQYIAPEYIQHNPDVPDGREPFKALASSPDRPLNYDEIVLLVGQGNFVATLSRANWNDGELNQDYAQVDIFRLANGKIVEHWDNVEPVPETHVNSGKF